MEKVIISLKNVFKIYGKGDGKTFALNDVSLDINEGEFVVILGASGSGKSTLLNLIAGIDDASFGSIFCDDLEITALNEKELTNYRALKVGYIFQFFNLLDDLNAYSNIILSPGANKNEKDVDKILDLVGLLTKKYNYPSELSGGEQQRVSIARALNKKTRFLLADEPTGALDYESGKLVLNLLEKINLVEKKTIILVTHTKEISEMADKIVYMRNGKIESIKMNEKKKKAEEIKW